MIARPHHPHLALLHDALAAEAAWVRQEHARLLRLSVPDRIAAGVTWPPLRLAAPPVSGPGWTRISLRCAARAPRSSSSWADLHDGITAGDRVIIGPLSTPDQGLSGRCTLVEGPDAEIRLEDDAALPGWLEGGHVAVTRALDESTLRRYQQGLLAADTQESALRTALLDPSAASLSSSTPPPRGALSGLHAAQVRAGVAALSAQSLALIHGPPGTGKTTLLVGLLRALVAAGERPWALADANAAVDHLAVRAAEAGLRVLRLGSPWRVAAGAASALTLDARIAAGPLAHPLRLLEEEARRASGREKWALIREIRDMRRQARDQILADCEVVAATLGTMAREAGALPRAQTALIDEATQATEPAIWSVVPHVKRLILLGDPEQLGPVVHEPRNPLARSLLERLIAAGVAAPMLEEQHRMSAPLLSLVTPVYGPRYRPHPAVAERTLRDLPGVGPSLLTGEAAPAAVWVDTAGSGLSEARDPVTRSLYNDGEVDLVALAVQALRGAGVSAADIGVIAPYSAQVSRLRAALPGVEVNTVNAFQGREKEVILCSWVRSNEDGELGFVADRRRLTVAVTRARRLLVCFGDSGTLARSPAFSALMGQVQALDPAAWQTVWEPPWDAALSA